MRFQFLFLLSFLLAHCAPDIKQSNSIEENAMAKSTDVSETSEITCPKCQHKKTEVLPTDVCTIKYTCEKCHAELTPHDGDCCVYCSYGTHNCPSMQDEN